MRQFIRQTGMMVALCLALTGLANAQGDPESWPTYDPPTNQQSDPKVWPEAKTTSAVTAGPSVDGAGLRAGLGTDISGGIAYGVALTYVKMLGLNGLELQFGAYGGTFKETTEEFHTYEEETKVLVIAAMANYMLGYSMDAKGPYFVFGFGAGAISVDWKETSPTDQSLGTPLGNGSMQEESATSGGSIINLGIGHRFTPKFDLRFQVPIFFIWNAPGESAATVPTFNLSAGLRF